MLVAGGITVSVVIWGSYEAVGWFVRREFGREVDRRHCLIARDIFRARTWAFVSAQRHCYSGFRVLMKCGELDDAELLLERCDDSGRIDAVDFALGLSTIRDEQKRVGEAIAILDGAIEKAPSEMQLVRRKLKLMTTHAPGAKAAQELEAALARYPNDPEILAMAIEFYHLGQGNRAERIIQLVKLAEQPSMRKTQSLQNALDAFWRDPYYAKLSQMGAAEMPQFNGQPAPPPNMQAKARTKYHEAGIEKSNEFKKLQQSYLSH